MVQGCKSLVIAAAPKVGLHFPLGLLLDAEAPAMMFCGLGCFLFEPGLHVSCKACVDGQVQEVLSVLFARAPSEELTCIFGSSRL